MKYFLTSETSSDTSLKVATGKKLLDLSNVLEPGFSKTRGRGEKKALVLDLILNLEKILFQLGVTLQEFIGMSLMEAADDEETLSTVSQAFVETNKHFKEAFDISRFFQYFISNTLSNNVDDDYFIGWKRPSMDQNSPYARK